MTTLPVPDIAVGDVVPVVIDTETTGTDPARAQQEQEAKAFREGKQS